MKATVFLCTVCCFLLSVSADLQQEPIKDEPWDYLLLAQFWPATSCVFFKEYGCIIPPGVDGWTIHGLWPSRNATEQPEFCDKSMTFNYSEIEVLRNQLDKYWPYYNKSGERSDLWAHEWDKHGTCAYSLPVISGELKYFNATLQLYLPLKIYEVLNTAGIIPTQDKRYNVTDVFTAVSSAYMTYPQISCLYSGGKHYLEQVWLCYNKTLNLINCPEVHLSSYRHFRSRTPGVQEPRLSLQFESEKHVMASKQHSYFVDCPKDGLVYYTPNPQDQAEVEVKVEVIENIMESYDLP